MSSYFIKSVHEDYNKLLQELEAGQSMQRIKDSYSYESFRTPNKSVKLQYEKLTLETALVFKGDYTTIRVYVKDRRGSRLRLELRYEALDARIGQPIRWAFGLGYLMPPTGIINSLSLQVLQEIEHVFMRIPAE